MPGLFRPFDVRRTNRHRVIAAIRRSVGLSRTAISAMTGLSAATISTITSDLLAEGILLSGPNGDGDSHGRGRPKVTLTVNPGAGLVGTAILQLGSIGVSIIDYAGTTVAESDFAIDTLAASGGDLRQAFEAGFETALSRLPAGRRSGLRRVSVAVQGVTDVEGTTMLWSPVTTDRNLPVAQWLADRFGVPVRLSNDCDAMARALNWADPDRFGRNFAAVLLSYGVGMGLFLRGGVINGTASSGMEFGHMALEPGGRLCRCGRLGCIEAYAADYGIVRRAAGRDGQSPPGGPAEGGDLAALAANARAGDPAARAAFAEAGTAIGTGLANLFALVDPFDIALVGSGAAAFDLMEPSMRKALGRSVAERPGHAVAIDCFPDERRLARQGCAVSAIQLLDAEFAASGAAMPA
jgi:predicted NBD/HSP70 family sugar kinase